MYVGVMHTVTDKAMWAQKLKEFAEGTLPDGYTNPITFIGSQTDYAFCLWDAPSIDALQPMLDGPDRRRSDQHVLPHRSRRVRHGNSGIPTQRIDLDTKASAKA